MEALTAAFNSFMDGNDGDGGGVVRIQKRDREPFVMTGGTMHKGSSEPMDQTKLFEIASVTKTFVSCLIAKKVVDGELEYSSTAASILGDDLPQRILVVDGEDKTNEITLEQLLTHRSGLPHFWSDGPKKSVEDWYAAKSLEPPAAHPAWEKFRGHPVNRFMFEGIARAFFEPEIDQDKIWKPSEVISYLPEYDSHAIGEFLYSDTNYVILGLVVEKLYSKTLNEAIQQDLMEPLLGHAPSDTFMRYNVQDGTDAAPKGSARYERLSHRYLNSEFAGRRDTTMSDPENFPGNQLVTSYYNSADWAGGGLVTTADDLAKFLMAVAEAKEGPWKEVKKLLMSSTASKENGYGYGIIKRGDLYGHCGDGGAVMQYHAGRKVVITGTCNNNRVPFLHFIEANLELILESADAQPPLAGGEVVFT